MPIPLDPTLQDDYGRPPRYGVATGPRETAVVVVGSSGAGTSRYVLRVTDTPEGTTPTHML